MVDAYLPNSLLPLPLALSSRHFKKEQKGKDQRRSYVATSGTLRVTAVKPLVTLATAVSTMVKDTATECPLVKRSK